MRMAFVSVSQLFGGEFWFTRLFLQRGLAVIYLVAFLAAAFQFRTLLGEKGLLPVPRLLEHARFWEAPSLFFLKYSDQFARILAWIGVALSVVAVFGLSERFGVVVSVATWLLLYVLYLSFVNVGQTWYAFGWESILLEAGFLAAFLGSANVTPSTAVIWLFRWLLFRIMFGAGLIKLRGDPCWRDLTCLVTHYETQPLPGPLSWYFHHLPVPIHKGGVLFNHFVELVVPFGYFLPQPIAGIAGVLTILFQGTLMLSGNLSWLNWLTLILAFSLFDDRFFRFFIPGAAAPTVPHPPGFSAAIIAVTALFAVLSVLPVRNLLSRRQLMNLSFNPFHLVGTYGAFGVITKERYEIVLEGTTDGRVTPETTWREYAFKGKPGDPSRRPPQVAPYHLRLDWLMWFAAFSPQARDVWFVRLVDKLLQGDRAIAALLRVNPFPNRPPAFIRAQYYRYRFTASAERRETGAWWRRELVGEYLPPVSASHPALRGLRSELE